MPTHIRRRNSASISGFVSVGAYTANLRSTSLWASFSASADLVTGKSDPLFDPHMFRFGRFEEGDEVRGQYEYSIVG